MYRVLLSTCDLAGSIARHTPGCLGIWEDFEFVINQPDADRSYDAVVVLESLPSPLSVTCPPENTFFIPGEPPELRTYRTDFLRQFRWVASCHELRHRGQVTMHQILPWHAGVDHGNGSRVEYDFDALAAMNHWDKPNVLSVVISNKTSTAAHRQRLEFVNQLKARLGDRLHVFGRGHQSIDDKWQALASYQYHLALENTARPYYITEKLCDAFLGATFPFYYGAPNAGEYFPEGSFEAIDVFNPEQAIETICHALDEGIAAERWQQIQAAREVVLHKMNMFPSIVALLREKMRTGRSRSMTFYPKKQHVRLAMRGVGELFRAAA